jgi:hypothetical protein
VGFRRIAHLNRKIEIEVHDRRLLAPAPKAAAWRVAGMASAAIDFLQHGRKPERAPAPAVELPPQIAIEPESADSELPQIAAESNPVAVLRRYGNQ